MKLADGEVVCPRKSGPFPSVIGAMACMSLNRQNPAACAKVECTQHLKAEEQGEHLRKHASEAMHQMFPVERPGESKAEDATRDAH